MTRLVQWTLNLGSPGLICLALTATAFADGLDNTNTTGADITVSDGNTYGPTGIGIFLSSRGPVGPNGQDAGTFDPPSQPGNPGIAGGVIQLTATGSVTTNGANDWGLSSFSVGGNGGKGGDGSTFRSASHGGAGGNGGAVTIMGSETIRTSTSSLYDGSNGILALSLGGNGGNGGAGSFAGGGFPGGAGGVGGTVTVSDAGYLQGWDIWTQGNNAPAISALSGGGGAGAGGSGGWLGGSAASGGAGAAGGTVNVYFGQSTNATILTYGKNSYGIQAESIGGFGGAGGIGVGVFVGSGGSGTSAGSGGNVTVNAGALGTIGTQGADAHGIFAESVGGGGGSGGGAIGIAGYAGGGAYGGDGGNVSVTNSGTITVKGMRARGIYAQSIGGGGGDGGESIGISTVGGNGSSTSNGGTVTVANSNTIQAVSNAILAQSIGGGGGSGGSSSGWFSLGGSGAGGGNGGAVTVTSHGTLSTFDTNATAIFAQSVGGGGGDGGSSIAGGAFITVAIGGSAGGGGVGGTVNVGGTAQADWVTGMISTGADNANGIQAESVGGGGGNGGYATSVAVGVGGSAALAFGGSGGTGNGGGTVNVNYGDANSTINTSGQNSNGIFAQSVGGGGGSGGMSIAGAASNGYSVGLSMGGSGGTGADGSTVVVQDAGAISTTGQHAYGILAQSVGGGGGNGGASVAGAASIDGGLALSFGGSGAGGGNGGFVQVTTNSGSSITTGTLTTTIGGSTVLGNGNAHGIFAQSVGGGGGSGGSSVAGGISTGVAIDVSFGGTGGGGGSGGPVNVFSSSNIVTLGDKSYAILAQSVGGGGGDGGSSVAGSITTTGPAINFSMGGKGGAGSDGGTVLLSNVGVVSTSGAASHGLFAQSLGGGGGSGGFSVAGSISAGPSIGVSLGGTGGGGGNGNTVTLDSFGGLVLTAGPGSDGLYAQSVGGGGGDGGFSVAGSLNFGSSATSGSVNVSLGGNAGTGGTAGAVTVSNISFISTQGTSSDGIFAQSLGGGGGNGGFSVAGSLNYDGEEGEAGPSVAFSLGGKGGGGGTGGNVTVGSNGNITTKLDNSHGIFAQSQGGGGGSGGFSVTGGISNGLGSIGVSIGGAGGDGNTAGTVHVGSATPNVPIQGTIMTSGDYSDGILALSVGGGGGSGGFSVSGSINTQPGSKAVNVAVGGAGGNAGYGGPVGVFSAATIGTSGDNSPGISAKSVGGGGGMGGMSVAGSLTMGAPKDSVSVSLPVTVGGAGGIGGVGGAVVVGNSGQINTGGSTSPGISAYSVGGGGGDGGHSLGISIGAQANTEGKNIQTNVAVGGHGGHGNTGGTVNVGNAGAIVTLADDSDGIHAQSIGGGGGSGGSAQAFTIDGATNQALPGSRIKAQGMASLAQSKMFPNNKGNNYQVSVAVGGNGGFGNDGGAVTVNGFNTIMTSGASSYGIEAQSIGAGGGDGGGATVGTSIAPNVDLPDYVNYLKNITIAVGGNAGGSGNGATVQVTQNANITTQGTSAFGVLAQSVGGGGGVATFDIAAEDPSTGGTSNIGATGKVGIGGGTGSSGNGGDVTVNMTGDINTSGNGAKGICAQTIGGGGGIAGSVDRYQNSTLAGYGAGNVGAGLSFSQAAGNGGTGGAATVTNVGAITTTGDNADGIYAQSVGGGGGIAGGLPNGGLNEAGSFQTFKGSVLGAGKSGAVTVNQTGNITTSGVGAYGIFAQSSGGAHGTVSGSNYTGSSGNVNVTVTNGNILVQGQGGDGILAQSRADQTNGGIGVTVNAGCTVQGGSGAAGVHLMDGQFNVITNFGTIASADGPNGNAIRTEANPISDQSTLAAYNTATNNMLASIHVTIGNHGTITGNVYAASSANVGTTSGTYLGTVAMGGGSLINHAGAVLNPGDVIDLGTANGFFSNAGTVSPGGAGRVQLTQLLASQMTQTGNAIWNMDLNGNSADEVLTAATASLSGYSNTINLNIFGNNLSTGAYTLLYVRGGGLTTGTFQLGTVSGGHIGFSYQLVSSSTTEQLVVVNTAGAYYWRGAVNSLWTSVGSTSDWTSDSAGTNPLFAAPSSTHDVYFSSTAAANRGTSLGANLTIHSLTFFDANPVSISSQPATSQTLTIAGNAGDGITAADNSGLVTIGANVTFAGSSNTISVNNAAGMQIDGQLVPNNGLIKSGAGVLTLSGANTYNSGTTISAGTLRIISLTGAGAGSITLGDANTGSNDVTLTGNSGTGVTPMQNAIVVANLGSGNATLELTAQNAQWGAPAIQLNRPTTFQTNYAGAGGAYFGKYDGSSIISGNVGTLTVQALSTGKAYVAGNNTFVGTVVLPQGNVWTFSANAFGGGGNSVVMSGTAGLALYSADLAIGSLTGEAGNSINTSANGNNTLTITSPSSTSTTFAGVISGPGSVTQAGSGTQVLSGANTYSGATNVNAGTLQIGDGTTGNLTATSGVAVSAGATLAMNLADGGTFDRAISLNDPTAALNAVQAGFNTITGTIGGSGSVNQNGIGVTILGGINTYTGATTVNYGSLQIGDGTSVNLIGTSGVVVGQASLYLKLVDGATFDRPINLSVVGAYFYTSQAGTNTLSGPISGSGSVVNAGNTTILTANNTYTGATYVAQGTLQVGNGVTGNLTATSGVYLVGGTLAINLADGGYFNPPIQLNDPSASLNMVQAGFNIIGGVVSGNGSLNVNGGGRVFFRSDNTYTGQTNINAGWAILGSPKSLGDDSGGVVVAAGATLDLNGNGFAVGNKALTIQGAGQTSAGATAALQSDNSGNSSWAGVVTLAGPTTIGGDIANTTLTLSNTVAGAFPLAKVGPNTLILSGDNTYSGNTTVSAGTLKFNIGSGAPTIAAGVTATVTAGATLELAGSVSGLGAVGGNREQIVNNSLGAAGQIAGLVVSGTNQVVGAIDGLGSTQVNAGSDLTADHIIQGALVIGGTAGSPGLVTIDASDASGHALGEPAGFALADSLTPSAAFGEGVNSSANLSSTAIDATAPVPVSAGNSIVIDNASSVPEPSALWLALLAVFGVATTQFARRHFRSQTV